MPGSPSPWRRPSNVRTPLVEENGASGPRFFVREIHLTKEKICRVKCGNKRSRRIDLDSTNQHFQHERSANNQSRSAAISSRIGGSAVTTK